MIIQNARKDNLLTKLADDDPKDNKKSFVRSDHTDDNYRKLNSSHRENQDEA